MPAGNPLAYLPPEIQMQLLGGMGPMNRAAQPAMPAFNSPQYAELVRRGKIAPPKVGTLEYLDFAARHPGLIAELRKQPARTQPQPGQNVLDIFSGQSALSRPGY